MSFQLTAGLDWLRITSPIKPMDALGIFPIAEFEQMSRGLYGYTISYGLPDNTIVAMSNPSRPDMKCSIQFSGQGLARLRSLGWTDDKLLRLYPDGKVSRIDIAIDTDNPQASPRDLIASQENGTLKTVAKSFQKVISEGEDTGTTFYIGSKSSDRRVRVYDKSAQLKLLAAFVTRIELTAKAERANAIASNAIINGVVPAGKAEIRSIVPDSGVDWFEDIINTDAANFSSLIERKPKNPERFAVKTIIPFLENSACDLSLSVRQKMIWLLSQDCGTSDAGISD